MQAMTSRMPVSLSLTPFVPRYRLPELTYPLNPVAELQDSHADGLTVGLNLTTGGAMDPIQEGVYDSFRVLRNCIASSTGIASNLLLCDEMLK